MSILWHINIEKEKNMRIAIPTDNPGGMDAGRSDHFGHCDTFTVVDVDDTSGVGAVETIRNEGHGAGGCMEPVQMLHDAKVEAIVVGGMGARPMQGFHQHGIKVYFASKQMLPNVAAVVDGFFNNKLVLMHADQVCKGSGNCHH